MNLLVSSVFRQVLIFVVAICVEFGATTAVHSQGTGYWHTSGNAILDANGTQVRITGINWYGFETTRAVAGGLNAQDYKSVLQTIKKLGYNTIRIPLSNQMVESPSYPGSINYSNGMNSDLSGLNSLQILDKIVTYAGSTGLKVILDNHRSEAGDSAEDSGLWFTGSYPEAAWINDWTMLANRYFNNPTVIGFDLRNEPHNAASGGACWDCGGANDWHLAAQRAGNAVLGVNPKLLIFVEGVDSYAGDYYWWGGNLQGVGKNPVMLAVPNQLVYSAHDYGPSVYGQPWFNGSTTAASLNAVWTSHWGFIAKNSIAPVWLGEFGTPNDAASVQSQQAGSEGQWFQSMVSYLAADQTLSWTYWALNGEDALGLLDSNYDPTPVNSQKQNMLAGIEFALNPGGSTPPPATVPAAPSGLTASAVSSSQVNLSWTASATGGVTYSIYSGTSPTSMNTPAASGISGTTYSVNGLSAGTTYYFVVKAVNANGSSSASNQASAMTKSNAAGSCHIAYLDQNDWGSGFTGNLSITTSAAVTSWTVTWSYAGNQQLNQSWNSNYTQSGKVVTLTNANWNGSIAAGATLTGIGWNANYSGTNANPVMFTLNGMRCQ